MHSGSLRRLGGYLRTRWISPRRIRFWLLALVVLYTLLGFFVLPRVIQSVAVDTVREDFGRELRIEAIHTNPYTLTLRINGLQLDDTDNRPLLAWERLSMDLAWSSLLQRAWTFKTIHLDKPIVQEERFASGETRLSRLIADRPDQDLDEDADEDDSPAPAVRIHQLRVTGGIVRFADNLKEGTDATGPSNPVSVALQGVTLSVRNFSLEEDTRAPVRLDAELEDGGVLAFDGTLQLLPTHALEGSARIDNLALVQAEPYLQQFLNVSLDSGTLNLSGELLADTQQPFAFRGSARIESLNIRDGSNDESLIGWQSLQTERLDVNLKDKQLESDPIVVESLSGMVIIHEDRSTNFSQLIAASGTDNGSGAKNNDDANTAPSPFDITIEAIDLNDGAVRFSDHSLPLHFSASIHTLTGQISTLSSTSDQPAEVELEGQVGEYGLVTMEGTVHAWQPTRETHLQLNFRNLQIPEYSPYTVNFAGRKIAEGTMDLDLGYKITDKQLDGSNNLVFRELKLGEKMESSDAMDLPLDLAIALLQDSDGVIDLDLPVTGDLGDPEFDVADIIRQALGDAIKSVVQAPFRFLASLVGSDSEDLGQIEFTEGNTELLPPQRARIDELREALNQRPALVIELAGPFSRTFDGPAVQREKAVERLQQHLAEADRDAEDPSLTTEANRSIVEAMFSEHYPHVEPTEVQARFAEEESESSDENGLDALAYRNHLAEQIIAAQSVTDEDLKAIAKARASAVRDALVDANSETNIADDRVRLQDPKEIDSVDGERIAMEVGISAD